MKQVQKYSFIRYTLSEQVWWYNVKQFLSYSKNQIYKFMQVDSWHHKLFHFHLSFWIWKVWKGRDKITRIWISRTQKELFRWNKEHFSVFKGLSFGEKIKLTQALRFSRLGDLSSVLKLLKEVSRLPPGAHWDEKCGTFKNSYLP